MRRRTLVILLVFASVIIAAIVVTVRTVTTRSVSAWVMTQDARPGAALGADNVHRISIPQGTDEFAVLTTDPTGKILAHAVRRDDVLRSDDLLEGTMVTVPITFKNAAPGLQPGDTVDIYGPAPALAATTGGETIAAGGANQLYGRGVTVITVGSNAAILVPASLEGYWVELSTAGVPLTAVLSQGIAVPPGRQYTLNDAERVLAGVADDASRDAVAATPAASPAAGG